MTRLTLVVNEVPESKETAYNPQDGSSGSILAVKQPLLHATDGRLGCSALGEPGVETDEGCKTFTLTAGLSRKTQYHDNLSIIFSKLTRIEGEAILGGTRPPRLRRMSVECMTVVVEVESEMRALRGRQFPTGVYKPRKE